MRIPLHSLSLSQQSVKYRAIKLFNSFSDETKLLPISTQFSFHFYQISFLLNKYYYYNFEKLFKLL